jgi:hypothetical protein
MALLLAQKTLAGQLHAAFDSCGKYNNTLLEQKIETIHYNTWSPMKHKFKSDIKFHSFASLVWLHNDSMEKTEETF